METASVNSYVEVSVSWPEASSENVAEEIIRPMEKAFSSIEDLNRIFATAEDGIGRIVLVFKGDAKDNEIIQAIKRQLAFIDKFP